MLCAVVDGSGYVVAEAATAPDCTYSLLTPAEMSAQTYWADVAMELEPSGSVFWPLLGAMVLGHAIVVGARLLVKAVMRANDEA